MVAAISGLALITTGCGGPSAANIALRKENQNLNDRIVELERQHKADTQSLAVLGGAPNTTQPAVNPTRLPELFTVVELKIGRLTGPTEITTTQPAIPALKVQVAPRDDTGDTIKAAGRMIVEVTDPHQSPEPLLGRWEFGPEELKKLWVSSTFVYAYVLPCPWETVPQVEAVRVKVRFIDFLTGRAIGPAERIVQMPKAQ
ncbi:MAG TPA: hypothetical protein VGN72_18760 [Tepidisphaeraceae bacterium]|jgi:hypothetical protein|nr:hypothetical protein [Tepidisphaeraceae bacterium]